MGNLLLSRKIFTIIGEEGLYFKFNETNIEEFKKINSFPFTYSNNKNKKVTMSYWYVNENVLENREFFYFLAYGEILINNGKIK